MQVLYRKYRPQTFSEVEGQEHVVKTLQGAIISGRTGHAYLFAGPRGTGKTTMARLFAKALNCQNLKPSSLNKQFNTEPCNECLFCTEVNDGKFIDMIEIDAASNRGIDEIRNIKESAQVASSYGGRKIFIIDEVHMLTSQAFNALLKVLEEPPSHVVFMLATTEPHKVIGTILSRVQRFDFKKISRQLISSKLARIALEEKIKIDDESINAIADSAGGSLRDAENALTKLFDYTDGPVTIEKTAEILGIVPSAVNERLLASLAEGESGTALTLLNELYQSGVDLENFSGQFISHLRAKLLDNLNPHTVSETAHDPYFLASTLKTFIRARSELKMSPLPQLPLELAIFEIAGKNK